MKRRTFLKGAAAAAGVAASFPASAMQPSQAAEKSLYELRIYHISRASNAKALLEQYYKDALIPFLKRYKATVGAFDEYSLEEPVKVYTLIAYPSPAAYFNVQKAMLTDEVYLKASKSYAEIPPSSTVYLRYETFLMEAFDRLPAITLPPADNRGLFELRIYEGHNEFAHLKKVEMFDREEIDLFLSKGMHPVFFGKILAGQYMPALIYMMSLPDMASRDTVWSRFNQSQEWATLRAKPEYANIVSNIRRIFLTPLSWSQV